jgi:hypothetical protein
MRITVWCVPRTTYADIEPKDDEMNQLRRLFVSYARQDRTEVEGILKALGRLEYLVWLDQAISGGQVWWEVILEQIRVCDGMIIVISPAMLRSEACSAELEYARQLGKPLLPVKTQDVRIELLPAALSAMQVVDCTSNDFESGTALAAAVSKMPTPPPLPEPLPQSPLTPVSYLANLNDRAQADELPVDEQLALIARLEEATCIETEKLVIAQIVEVLQSRSDLSSLARVKMGNVLDRLGETHTISPQTSRASAKLLQSYPNERLLGLTLGEDMWFIRFERRPLRPSRVLVNDDRVDTLSVRGACRFDLQRKDGTSVTCDISFNGTKHIRQLIFSVEGEIVYAA